jgi:hypothetical protein
MKLQVNMSSKLKDYLPSKSFILGVILTVGIFSRYIFGANNLAEEVSELALKITTGKDINFSADTPEDPNKDLNRLVE